MNRYVVSLMFLICVSCLTSCISYSKQGIKQKPPVVEFKVLERGGSIETFKYLEGFKKMPYCGDRECNEYGKRSRIAFIFEKGNWRKVPLIGEFINSDEFIVQRIELPQCFCGLDYVIFVSKENAKYKISVVTFEEGMQQNFEFKFITSSLEKEATYIKRKLTPFLLR